MICPVCRKGMLVVEYRQIEIDYCQACIGVWFDSGELELLLKTGGIEGARPFLGDVLKLSEARTLEKKRKCPICTKNMRKVKIGGEGGVLVDACERHHGLWFDGGEVVSLIKTTSGQLPEKKGNQSEIIGFLKDVFKTQ